MATTSTWRPTGKKPAAPSRARVVRGNTVKPRPTYAVEPAPKQVREPKPRGV